MSGGTGRLNRLESEGSGGDRLRHRVLARLKEIAGGTRVAADPETLYVYSRCMAPDSAVAAGAVVMPESVEEVQAVARLCNEELLPLAAYVTGAGPGGYSYGPPGGIIIDLKRMDRIIEVNEKSWYALIEPAVTFAALKAHLEKNHRGFVLGYPYAPPSAPVTAEALAAAAADLSLRHGDMSEWIRGMEVVLPSGEVVDTGAGEKDKRTLKNSPLSDIAALMAASRGQAGICTKLAIHIQPRPAHTEKRFVLAYGFPEAFRIMREAATTLEFDDLALFSNLVMKGALAAGRGPKWIEASQGEPAAFLVVAFSGANPDETRNKDAILAGIVRRQRRRGVEMIDAADLREINPGFASLADPPTSMGFIMDQGRGCPARLDARGPADNMAAAAETGAGVIERHGFRPLLVCRAVRGLQSAAMSFMVPHDSGDSAARERLGECMHELTASLLDLGFTPTRPHDHAAREFMERESPQLTGLHAKIRMVIDPNGIMDPMRGQDA